MSKKEYFVAKENDILEGGSVAVQAGSRTIAVFRVQGKFYAILNRCLHKGGSLCEGTVVKDRKVVRCPWHLWDWSLETGHLEAYPRKRMLVFDVRVVDGEVFLKA